MSDGVLIGVREEYFDDIANAISNQDTDHIFYELCDVRDSPEEAFRPGAAYAPLAKALRSRGVLGLALSGEQAVRSFDDGAAIFGIRAGSVRKIAGALSTQADVIRRTLASGIRKHELGPKPKLSVLGKDTAKDLQDTDAPSSLVKQFDALANFYTHSAKEGMAVFGGTYP